jgi:hypothetical protein
MKQLKYNECEVGDIIVDKNGGETKILAVFEEGLVKKNWYGDNITAYTWEEIEFCVQDYGWHIKEETDCLKCSYGHNDFDFNYCPFCGKKLK